MQGFLEFVVRNLVDYPDEVVVTRGAKSASDSSMLFELRMRRSDVGKVVGKQGQTIAAIRGVLNAVAPADSGRIRVEIVEEPREGAGEEAGPVEGSGAEPV
jgi:predicted RNA-binding protein YlqC (UPF0109 family)